MPGSPDADLLDLPPFAPERFRALAAPQLTHDVDEVYARPFNGDHELNPDYPVAADRPRLRDAAVLVPVVARRPEASVIMTRRTEHLPNHAGQIAFPGGKIDEGDLTPAEAALREAEEEIGLERAHVEVLGYSAPYHTGSGFRILPVLALVEPGFRLAPNPEEVAEVFEVPLGFLMNPENHRVGSRVAPLGRRFFYEMPYGDRYIWGVTAGIVRRIFERVYL
ncbi:CoA pyrophosphatase [Prosthecomicrobium sp. N25]|uniref:CoA pyrophosphatase n=1 Tax=Prosthecomicrobium sp. N25 TaxID=3129254 RepID=UPI00307844D5